MDKKQFLNTIGIIGGGIALYIVALASNFWVAFGIGLYFIFMNLGE